MPIVGLSETEQTPIEEAILGSTRVLVVYVPIYLKVTWLPRKEPRLWTSGRRTGQQF